MIPRRRRSLAGLLTVAAVALTGCSGAPPNVTFDVGGTSLVAAPTQFCDNQLKNCEDAPNARVTAGIAPGTTIRVTVPEEVSEGPWQLAYAYVRGNDPTPIRQRSDIAPVGTRTEFTLRLPEPGDRLVTAQVQLFGPAPAINPDTRQIEFPVRATWVLVAEQPQPS